MSTHKAIEKICCVVFAVTFLLMILYWNAGSLGVQKTTTTAEYESRLFDTSAVHHIDIQMEDWNTFLANCQNEEYELCTVTIDDEAYENVAIRAKGNTSLMQVASYGNNRYSFKIEFDHYDNANTYYGLDKLCLNNIIQDNTYMKDYICYQMMSDMGVASPLCSYTYITVNGEDWGLYLAVEGVEESFLERNYGKDYGELYKPDSQSMGGGRGNGENFDMDNVPDITENSSKKEETETSTEDTIPKETTEDAPEIPQNKEEMTMPENGNAASPPEMPGEMQEDFNPNENMPQNRDGNSMTPPGGERNSNSSQPDAMPTPPGNHNETPENEGTEPGAGSSMQKPEMPNQSDNTPMDGNHNNDKSMGSDDVRLKYIDDDFDSYPNIFENAKTDISNSDKTRLIQSLKNLSEQEDIEETVNTEAVIRYFVVHNFVLNFDSYTGAMIHNYYLYEKNGQMEMIPWDYNLAFGGFQSAGGAESLVNYPIDSPVSGGSTEDRPMIAWIFDDETYTAEYHQYFEEFIADYFDSGYFEEMIDRTTELISPYVEKDPTKFCTYEEFELGAATLKEFCLLRAESVKGQLTGTIGSTSETQDQSTFVSAENIQIDDMGSMNHTEKK